MISLARDRAKRLFLTSCGLLWIGLLGLGVSPALAQSNTLRVSKAFDPAVIEAGGTGQMIITLYNTDTSGPQTGVGVTDDFPAGVTWTSVASNSCGGTLSAPGASLTLTGGTVPVATGSGPSTCTLVVNITAPAVGSYDNTIPSGGATGVVNGNPTANENPAVSTLTVVSSSVVPLTGTKAFAPTTMALGETGSFTIRINNANVFDISGVAFSDDLAAGGGNITSTPAGGSLVPTGITSNTCGGTAGISGSTVSLSGGSIPGEAFCTVTVTFTATAAGTYTNRLPAGAITAGSDPALSNVAAISANLAVQENAVTLVKSFSVEEAFYPDPFIMTLRFTNNTSSVVENLALTDHFPDTNANGVIDLVVSELAPQVTENTCGGTVTAPALATSVSLGGGTIAPNASCVVRIRVRASESVTPDFRSENITEPGTGTLVGGGDFTFPPGTAGVVLRSNGEAIIVGLAKSYLSTNVDTGTVVRGRLQLMTPENVDIVAYTITDTFQPNTTQGNASDVVMAPVAGNFTFQNCGASPMATPLGGGNGFTLSNIAIQAQSGGYYGATTGWPNPACVVEFDVLGNVPGTHVNTIPIDQGAARRATDAPGVVRGILNRHVTTNFTYLSPLSVTKAFTPGVVSSGGLSRLVISLSNRNNANPITNLSLTDNLPVAAAGSVEVTVAPVPNIGNTCGGTVTAVPGSSTVTLAGGAVLPGSEGGVPGLCEIAVDVVATDTVDGDHSFLNRIGAGTVTGIIGGAAVSNNANADANIHVRAVGMAVSKTFSPATIDGGDTTQLTVTISNPNTATWLINGIGMTDTMPAGMVVADPANATTTCTVDGIAGGAPATVTATPGAGSFSLGNGALYGSAGAGAPAGAISACTVTVTVRALISDNLVNTIAVGDVTSAGGAVNTNAFSATLVVLPNTRVTKRFVPDTIPVGGLSELEFEVLNANTDVATGISIQDIMPTQVTVADPLVVTPVDACPGLNVSAAPGSNTIQATGLNLGANERCRFRVQVTSLTPGTWTNTILSGQVSSDQGGIRTVDATDDLTVVNGPEVDKSFADDSFVSGGTTQLTMSVRNPATGGTPLTNVVFVDNLPAGMTLADPVNLVTAGACGTGTVTATAGATSVTWSGGTLAGNASCDITVDVTATTVGTYTNVLPACDLAANPPVAGSSAAATGNDGGNVTCNTLGAEDTVEVIVPAELSFVKALANESIAADNVAQAGEELTYTITITNDSTTDATAVPVIDIVPEHTTFVSADNGGALNGGQVEWSVDVPGESQVVLTVVFRVADPIPAGVAAIANNATVDGEGCATDPCVETPTVEPAFTVTKAVTAESGAVDGIAEAGEEITYTITVANTAGIDAADVAIVDVVPANTSFVSASDGGVLNGSQVEWTADVPANGAITRTVVFRVADPIPAGVTAIANSATANGEGCATTPCVETPTVEPAFTVTKAVTAESGATPGVAEPGEEITYTITVANTAGIDAADVAIVDVVPANTSFVSASDGGVLNGNQVEWTADVPANGAITRTVVFRVADPIPAGVTAIANSATANGEGCATTPCVETPAATPEFTLEKALTGESGGATAGMAEAGEQLTYTLTVANTSGANATNVVVVDVVPANTSFVSADNGGTLNGDQVQWTLDIAAHSSVTLSVVFQVDDPLPDDVTTIANNATVNGEGCAATPCVETPVGRPVLEFDKVLSAEGGGYAGIVEPGEQLTYAITVTNSGTAAATQVPVVDTLDPNVAFVSADNGGTHANGLVNWTVERIEPDQSVTLTVTVQAPATFPAGLTRIVNNATVDGEACATQPCVETPVARPPVAVDDDGGVNQVGLAVTLATPGNDQPATAPLDLTSVWIVGTAGPNQPLAVPGEGTWSVNPATGEITFTPEPGFGNNPTPIRYTIADTLGLRSNEAVESLEYTQDFLLRLSKKASVRTVVVGDLVQYTLTLENIGGIDVVDATVQDVPPNGFTLVPGSLRVNDGDHSGTLVSTYPMRIDGIDVASGQTATITYLMAVGAGTLPGTHTNTAVVLSNEVPISNEASATVVSTADPLLEQSLIIGTVFNDRDGDGWQDSAKATDIVAKGGIDESVYVAGSTTVDAGQGPQPQADASAPLNHGLKLGTLAGRNSVAEAEDAHRIVISQRLREARFADGFTLVTGEGTTLRMDAAGNVGIERSGDAARGLTAQDIRVRREVTPLDGGEVRVDYIVSNAGIDERGIPGVRIGTVEGLLVETDGYGRFHLEGVTPSHYARGSNFIMKVDTATLPRGSTFTTENPRVKRVTPGVMARFDFGVKVPEDVIEGGTRDLRMDLGEVVFEANSAVVRPQYAKVIEHMAAQVRTHGGGAVDITGFGGDPELALARAKAVHEALLAQLPSDLAGKVDVSVRGETDGPEVLTYGQRIGIGEVFFDTDKSTVKPAYDAVIRKIAAEVNTGKVGELVITGHTDKRASDAYNLALGQRRADAVLAAIRAYLTPEQRDRIRVQHLPPSSAEAPYESGRGQ
ncbi:OmpA family protein [Pseudoxanthomonas putridarboris]|uniref:OmpA family protein n=1 Tax=Pseudoxanthomonas putridarboris TaxID=752605 RepID=A0ABU9J5I4_9GAMM